MPNRMVSIQVGRLSFLVRNVSLLACQAPWRARLERLEPAPVTERARSASSRSGIVPTPTGRANKLDRTVTMFRRRASIRAGKATRRRGNAAWRGRTDTIPTRSVDRRARNVSLRTCRDAVSSGFAAFRAFPFHRREPKAMGGKARALEISAECERLEADCERCSTRSPNFSRARSSQAL